MGSDRRPSSMKPDKRGVREAERVATYFITALGGVGGALLGLLYAPRITSYRRSTIDPTAWGPAILIIVLGAATGAFVAWRASRRRW
jgi:ABC-type antimicrobial peptide transport system permease subunit